MPTSVWEFSDVTKYYRLDNVSEKKKGSIAKINALRNISFEQKSEEIVGIIGVKGAGKSTLCSLLTGEFPPDSGKIKKEDKLALNITSPLVVDDRHTGEQYAKRFFIKHGIKHNRLAKMIRTAVEFSELGDVIGHKLKTYSGEQLACLEISLAVTLKPAVLCFDEVISELENPFQLKVIEQINRLKATGSSVWIVSDNLNEIANYCDKVMWLEFGELMMHDSTEKVIEAYQIEMTKVRNMSIDEQRSHWDYGHQMQLVMPRASVKKVVKTARSEKVATSEYSSQESPLEMSRVIRRQSKTSKPFNIRSLIFYGMIVALVGGIVYVGWPLYNSLAERETKTAKEIQTKKLAEGIIMPDLSQAIGLAKPAEKVAKEVVEKPAEKAETHTVKTYETLSIIAERYGITLKQLKEWNGLKSDTIEIGTVLKVIEPAIKEPVEPDIALSSLKHQVVSGDSISSIADKYGVSTEAILKANGLGTPTITPGQTLSLPEGAIEVKPAIQEVASQPQPQAQGTYTVQPGDTLYRIAKSYGKTVPEFQQANNMSDIIISKGQVLVVPQ